MSPTMDDVNLEFPYSMFKGEPGTRKSTQALSYPTPQYWFSVDQKMDALVKPMKHWGIKASEISYDNYTDWNSIKKKLEQLQTNCSYKTLIFDSITSIADVSIRQVIRAKSGQTNRQGESKGNIIGGIPVSGFEEFKAESAAFNELVAITKDINQYFGCNIILIAHVIGEREDKQVGAIAHARIIATGAKIISAKIPAYCSEIYQFTVGVGATDQDGGVYGVNTEYGGGDFARTSLPLPLRIELGDRPLYQDFIKPAIDKLKEK